MKKLLANILLIITIIIIFSCDPLIINYFLKIDITPVEGGYVTPGDGTYHNGTSISLTANSNPGYAFDHWDISNGVSEKANPINIIMGNNIALTANFIIIDFEAPVITLFDGPDSTSEANIDIILEGSDNYGIKAWLVKESSEVPTAASPDWTETIPSVYTLTQSGTITLYAWAMDNARNISASASIIIVANDTEPPIINAFSAPSISKNTEIPITLNGTDNFGTVYKLVTESESIPSINNPYWSDSQNITYSLKPLCGTYTLYGWLKDTTGNISEPKSIIVFLDYEKPVITQFTGPATTYTYSVDLIIEGTDNEEITGWVITANSTIPELDTTVWNPDKPTRYYLPKHGINDLYLWARDKAGNISASLYVMVEKKYKGLWTIMIWMDGDNNLERNAMMDMNEIEFGLDLAKSGDPDIEDKLSIIVQVDRIAGYDTDPHDNGADWIDTRRYLMKPHAESFFLGKLMSQKLGESFEANMGNANDLKSFVQYCMSSFESENYCLILWNHGGGVKSLYGTSQTTTKGMCIDLTNGSDTLYTGEITDSLSALESVKLLGIDACFMGTLEIAYEYRPDTLKFGAQYFVGSPATENSDGWPYYSILFRLSGSANVDFEGDTCYDIETLRPEDMASIIVKEYADTNRYTSYATLTALDLGKIQDVKIAVDALSREIRDNMINIEGIRGEGDSPGTLNYFNTTSVDEWISLAHFDLYDLAERIEATSGFLPGVYESITPLKDVIDSCIIESWAGFMYSDYKKGYNGLAIFFPDGNRKYNDKYCHYKLQHWYTAKNLSGQPGCYGNIDFCDSNENNVVENWKELLEYWYDPLDTLTPDKW